MHLQSCRGLEETWDLLSLGFGLCTDPCANVGSMTSSFGASKALHSPYHLSRTLLFIRGINWCSLPRKLPSSNAA